MWLSLSGTFLWNFTDLFIMLVSSALAAQFHLLTTALKKVRAQVIKTTNYDKIPYFQVSIVLEYKNISAIFNVIDSDYQSMARISRNLHITNPFSEKCGRSYQLYYNAFDCQQHLFHLCTTYYRNRVCNLCITLYIGSRYPLSICSLDLVTFSAQIQQKYKKCHTKK